MQQHPYRQEPEPKPKTPYIQVIVKNTFAPIPKEFSCQALLDTGSDFTIFPIKELAAIDLKPIGENKLLQGVSYATVRPFLAYLVVNDKQFPISVLGWNHNMSILGRDVLNMWRVDFDAPSSLFTIH